ncbi:1,6-anhydro-N-acetylmuramyl-L-alanine amidase AmpD [Providencia sp. PROV188]|uniref:1,6-anhydro-N-acetylmuramyl-L-alanine amidase AmpD n=1 Tax=Providencia TaxID=586 RepID=UPI00055E0CD4|nr:MULTISPECIES: 1,6-anhydro-N-acetylmuramyl-L-alanine amidase AmpD [Providencia]MTB47193.1 1,6-anhydro-N-acetylmuramyl-L-alanine amidase AmpD [Providencia sp. wls1950]MTC23856.1 1,6-anhydro-N-acetylmuramyl-L-alanine amidase AmpD [Providencia sp. wls1938]MTC44117.1 1,6-anhydro-N-acetylmuramyl-L-alanine amidase AmpD [Providencia sp. wls1921]MTC46894.1 1,6-anhydro-N-acetylmuramyl-L-alanine amidase AmpD [Providencia sp. wls1922]MTC78052.1 1,6-anhydro-N-acetylmuramyl-L-alanine amidase AmpD [Provid
MKIHDGWLNNVTHIPSPHHDDRPEDEEPSLLVIHNISLPPGQFGGPYINQLFTGTLNPEEHPFFEEIKHLRVSAHCLIRRDGEIIQYVPFNKRAWHAGQSNYQGREKCNDFSIGIELEGTDYQAFTEAQYITLAKLTKLLITEFPQIKQNITGHSDIAPHRKTDPGPYFDWQHYKNAL